jgi:hypothetical protein
MRYIILKELLPSLKGTPDYDESMNFITKSICIENDELYVYDTLEEAETKKIELLSDSRYQGRELKIKETTEF